MFGNHFSRCRMSSNVVKSDLLRIRFRRKHLACVFISKTLLIYVHSLIMDSMMRFAKQSSTKFNFTRETWINKSDVRYHVCELLDDWITRKILLHCFSAHNLSVWTFQEKINMVSILQKLKIWSFSIIQYTIHDSLLILDSERYLLSLNTVEIWSIFNIYALETPTKF